MKEHLLSTDPTNWEEFESDSIYKTEIQEIVPPLPTPLKHDISMTRESDSETQPRRKMKNRGNRTRTSIWNYFFEDKKDPTFVFCTTCQKRLSRGKTGNRPGKLSCGSMKPHLKSKHIEVWKEYIELKTISQTKDIPESIEEVIESGKTASKTREEIFWEYLENGLGNVSIQDSTTLSLHEISEHLTIVAKIQTISRNFLG